jgi:alpha-N-arabinofuranosidase
MTPEYYSDLYKRYQTYVRNYPGSRITKVACGPNGYDMSWAESIIKNIGPRMDAYGAY